MEKLNIHFRGRSCPKLMDLFNEFGQTDVDMVKFSITCKRYKGLLSAVLIIHTLKKIIEAAFDPRDYLAPNKSPEIIFEKNSCLPKQISAFDNYILMKEDKKAHTKYSKPVETQFQRCQLKTNNSY